MKRRRTFVLVTGAILLAVAIFVASRLEGVRWRATVVAHKAGGGLESLSWFELVSKLKPSSRVYIGGLAELPNPYAAILKPYTSKEDFQA